MMDENKKKECDSFEDSNVPEFCDVMEAQPQLLKVLKKDLDVSSISVGVAVSAPLIQGLNWPSSSWADGSHRSAFQPYRPSTAACNNTILTNLQRGNTETETPKQDYSEFTWHQKAGRGDIAASDIPSDFFINRLDSEGLTALMWASSYGQYSSVQLLLNAGASVNTQGLKGETSLLLCSSEGHLDILRLLIANGAKVNHTDKAGNTPLIYASYNNHHHCVHELLINGADLTAKNNLGVSAYSAAVGRKNRLVAAVIEKYLLSLLDEEEDTDTDS